jgi:hypothetical protein
LAGQFSEFTFILLFQVFCRFSVLRFTQFCNQGFWTSEKFDSLLLGKWCPTFENQRVAFVSKSSRSSLHGPRSLEDEGSSHLASNVELPVKSTESSFVDFFGMDEYEFFIAVRPKHQAA